MISVETVVEQHNRVLATTGGAQGIRDLALLESAVQRPFQSFGGEELYPDVLAKTAALLESLITNHPFVDGNKRTGWTIGRTFMLANGHQVSTTEDERYDFIVAIASGQLDYDGILAWLRANTQPY